MEKFNQEILKKWSENRNKQALQANDAGSFYWCDLMNVFGEIVDSERKDAVRKFAQSINFKL